MEAERNAIKACYSQLLEHINPEIMTPYFRGENVLSDSDYELLENMAAGKKKAMALLDILQHRDGFWQHLLNALDKFNQSFLAKMLIDAMISKNTIQSQTSVHLSDSNSELLTLFKRELAEFYTQVFSMVQLIRDLWISIDDVWVDLEIKDQETGKNRPIQDYTKICENLSSVFYPQMVLIEGDAGKGKSTLVRKFCHDWATNLQNNATHEPCSSSFAKFELVLCCPLRNVDFGDTIIALVLAELLPRLRSFRDTTNAKQVEAAIFELVTRNPTKVLVILDGLDEAKENCCPEFDQACHPQTSRLLPCSIVVTSRPEAVEQIKSKKLHYVVVGLSDENVRPFVEKYCPLQTQRRRLLKYMDSNSDMNELFKTPMLLMLCCMLCKFNEPLPKRLLDLYDTFCQWLMKYHVQRVSSTVDTRQNVAPNNWRELPFALSLAKLAYSTLFKQVGGVLIFDANTLKDYAIDHSECVTLGFLGYSYQPVIMQRLYSENEMKVAFPHKSFQEYFAAMHLASCPVNAPECVNFCKLLSANTEAVNTVSAYGMVLRFLFAQIKAPLAKPVVTAMCDSINSSVTVYEYTYRNWYTARNLRQICRDCNDDNVRLSLRELGKQLLCLDNIDEPFFFAFALMLNDVKIASYVQLAIENDETRSNISIADDDEGVVFLRTPVHNGTNTEAQLLHCDDSLDQESAQAVVDFSKGTKQINCLSYEGSMSLPPSVQHLFQQVTKLMIIDSVTLNLFYHDTEPNETCSTAEEEFSKVKIYGMKKLFVKLNAASVPSNLDAFQRAIDLSADAKNLEQLLLWGPGLKAYDWIVNVNWNMFGNLKTLWFNAMNAQSVAILSSFFNSFQYLQDLRLNNNGLGLEHDFATIKLLNRNILSLSNSLLEIELCDNQLQLADIMTLLRTMTKMKVLKSLDVSTNKELVEDRNAFEDFVALLAMWTVLERLYVSECELTDWHAETLSRLARKHPSLELLALQGNPISMDCYTKLSEKAYKNSNGQEITVVF